jgi:hypothetical protein
MPKKTPIPLELQQRKAHELYLKRLSQGLDNNSEEDWENAREYLVNHPREIWSWRACTFLQKILALFWRMLSFPFGLFWKLSLLLTESETKAFSLDVIKTQITALGLVATFFAGIGLIINYWSSEKNIQLTEDRLVTDRFAKAIEQIGSGKEEVILGG